jgi:hypothetical protein
MSLLTNQWLSITGGPTEAELGPDAPTVLYFTVSVDDQRYKLGLDGCTKSSRGRALRIYRIEGKLISIDDRPVAAGLQMETSVQSYGPADLDLSGAALRITNYIGDAINLAEFVAA